MNSSVVICPLATIWITHLGVKLFISHRIWLLDLLYSFPLNVHVSLISFFKCIFQKKSITSFGSIVLLIHSHNGNSCKRSPFNLLASFFLNASPQIYFIPQQLFIYFISLHLCEWVCVPNECISSMHTFIFVLPIVHFSQQYVPVVTALCILIWPPYSFHYYYYRAHTTTIFIMNKISDGISCIPALAEQSAFSVWLGCVCCVFQYLILHSSSVIYC